MNSQSGKGDKPRSCFSKLFKKNYDEINWKSQKKLDNFKNKSHSLKSEAENSGKSNQNS